MNRLGTWFLPLYDKHTSVKKEMKTSKVENILYCRRLAKPQEPSMHPPPPPKPCLTLSCRKRCGPGDFERVRSGFESWSTAEMSRLILQLGTADRINNGSSADVPCSGLWLPLFHPPPPSTLVGTGATSPLIPLNHTCKQ